MIFALEDRPTVLQLRQPVSEQEFVQDVKRVSHLLFSEYELHSWAPIIRDRRCRRARPDAALIRRDLSEWFVVEFELADHPLSHIDGQLNILSDGIYDLGLAASISAASGLHDDQACKILTRPPQFLCVINEERDSMRRACRQAGFEVLVAQPFSGYLGASGVLASYIPPFLTDNAGELSFGLRRSRAFGDRTFMELPPGFPLTAGVVTLHVSTGPALTCVVDGRNLHLPSNLIRAGYSYSLRISDLNGRSVILEEEKSE